MHKKLCVFCCNGAIVWLPSPSESRNQDMDIKVRQLCIRSYVSSAKDMDIKVRQLCIRSYVSAVTVS